MNRLLPWIAFAALAALAGPAVAAAMPHAGDVAPAFDLPRVGAPGSMSLASLHGKPVYINFFASWCAPCNEEAPSVQSLTKKYHSRGLVTVGVDEQESPNKGLEFLKSHALTYPAVSDESGKMGEAYGIIAMPVHVFIGRDGKISTYRTGEMEPAEIEAAIQKIL